MTIRSYLRPKVTKFFDVVDLLTSTLTFFGVCVFLIILSFPIWAMIAVSAWWNEKSISQEIIDTWYKKIEVVAEVTAYGVLV